MDPNAFFFFVFVYIAVILLFAYIVLFGDNPSYAGTPISCLHHFLTTFLPDLLCARFAHRLCGKRRITRATAAAAHVFEKYIMPAAYLALLATGLYFVNRTILSRLPELEVYTTPTSPCPRSRFYCHPRTGLSIPPRTPARAAHWYAAVALASWLRVALADAGAVTARTFLPLAALYPYDGVLFSPGPPCRTCHLPKLPRSKHCALCNRCVARFDHHCGWVGSCVGFYNTGRFLVFLAVHTVMLVHGALLAAEVVHARVMHLVAGGYVHGPTNTPVTHFTFATAFAAETNVCVLVILLALMALLVASFMFYHISLVLTNTTTNETDKWDSIMQFSRDYPLHHDGKSIGQAIQEEVRAEAAQSGDPGPILATVPSFDQKGLPLNVYNRGVLANLFEVFAPRWYQAQCSMSEVEENAWLSHLSKAKEH